jgi:ribonuclease P protein component
VNITHTEGLPKEKRLRRKKEFAQVFAQARKRHSPHLLFLTRENGGGHSRIGLTVSRKVGNAVVRNRIKRMLRESFRRLERDVWPPLDVVVIARKGAADLDYEAVKKAIQNLTDSGQLPGNK